MREGRRAELSQVLVAGWPQARLRVCTLLDYFLSSAPGDAEAIVGRASRVITRLNAVTNISLSLGDMNKLRRGGSVPGAQSEA